MSGEPHADAALSTAPPAAAARRRRRWRWARLAAWAVFWLWFAHFAWVRYTTPPAIVARGVDAPGRRVNPEEERFAKAIEEVGTHPIWKAQSWELAQAFRMTCRKPLDQVRSSNGDLVTAVTDPKLRKQLDELTEAAADFARASRPGDVAMTETQPYWWNSGESLAIGSLILRSRLDRDAGLPIGDAVTLLAAAFEVGQQAERRVAASPYFYWFDQTTLMPLLEIGRLALDEPLPLAEARRMIDTVSRDGGLRVSTLLADGGIIADVDALLDRYYTDDGTGDGWLVLSAAAETPWLYPIDNRLSTSPIWNLFSPLFHSRREIRSRVEGLLELLASLDSADYIRGSESAEQAAMLHRTLLDGPLMRAGVRLNSESFRTAADLVRRRRATVIFLALSAYKHDHGAYPDRLDLLAPDYLAEVPDDSFTASPFRYALKDGDVEFESSATIGNHTFGMLTTSDDRDLNDGSLVPRRYPESVGGWR